MNFGIFRSRRRRDGVEVPDGTCSAVRHDKAIVVHGIYPVEAESCDAEATCRQNVAGLYPNPTRSFSATALPIQRRAALFLRTPDDVLTFAHSDFSTRR